MPTTRMDSRMELVEMEIKRVPVLEDSMNSLQNQVGDVKQAVEILAQKMEELLRRPTGVPPPLPVDIPSSSASKSRAGDRVEQLEDPLLASLQVEEDVHRRGSFSHCAKWEPDFQRSEMPFFEGQDPDSWVYKVEWFFELHDIPEHLKLHAARVSMGGAAQVWLQIEERKRPFSS